jgi:Ni/Co efflux regulator RcnB
MKKMMDSTTDPKERMRLTIEGFEKAQEIVRQSQPELFREMDAITETGKGLANQLKFKMFDVLTDEQWKRMIDLIDNPPDYVKKLLAERRKAREAAANQTANKPGEWMPGPNSWRPGDPVPEQYRQQRNERQGHFPRSESE